MRQVLVRSTGRWYGVVAVTLLLGGVGVLVRQPGLLVAGVVGIAVAALAQAGRPPSPSLDVEHVVSDASPAGGQPVTVSVSVTNTGSSLFGDLRFVDGVPDALAVERGSPRHATALRPGKTTTFEYDVSVSRGVHAFDDLLLVARDFAGANEARFAIPVDTTVRCVPELPASVPLSLPGQTSGIAGRVATNEGGPGHAFHAVREYRRGDPLNRIDWNRAARTGEFSTVEFQRERSATVVVLVDARTESYVAPDDRELPVLERSVAAAGALFAGFLDTDNLVGLSALSPTELWVQPSAGQRHRSRVRDLLATHPSLSPTAPEEPFFGTVWLNRFRRRLPSDAQVVLCTPLVDEYAERVAHRLHAYGHRVTVVSPDPTTADTPGRRLARTERLLRASALRERRIRVVDWGDEPLRTAVERATRRWSG